MATEAMATEAMATEAMATAQLTMVTEAVKVEVAEVSGDYGAERSVRGRTIAKEGKNKNGWIRLKR